jgi:hypothetical protein
MSLLQHKSKELTLELYIFPNVHLISWETFLISTKIPKALSRGLAKTDHQAFHSNLGAHSGKVLVVGWGKTDPSAITSPLCDGELWRTLEGTALGPLAQELPRPPQKDEELTPAIFR